MQENEHVQGPCGSNARSNAIHPEPDLDSGGNDGSGEAPLGAATGPSQ